MSKTPGTEKRSMFSYFSMGFGQLGKLFSLLGIPFILDLIDYGYLLAIPPTPGTFHIGVKFSLPVALPSVSNFYNFPRPYTGLFYFSFESPIFFSIFIALPILFLFMILRAFLVGGYVGSIYETATKTGKEGFLHYARTRFLSLLVFEIIMFALTIFVMLLVPILFIFPILMFFIVSYLFYLVPFIIVVDNKDPIAAIRKSIDYTLKSEAFVFAVVYAIINAVISFFIHLLMNMWAVGLLLGILIAAYVGTGLVASTVYFYLDFDSRVRQSAPIGF